MQPVTVKLNYVLFLLYAADLEEVVIRILAHELITGIRAFYGHVVN